MNLLSATLDGIKMRRSPVSGSTMTLLPSGAGETYRAFTHECPARARVAGGAEPDRDASAGTQGSSSI